MKTISLAPYPGTLYVARNEKEFQHHLKKLFQSEIQDQTGNRGSFWHCGAICLVWARKDSLLHELTHVALHIFDYISLEPSSGNGEAFCYFLEHLYNKAK